MYKKIHAFFILLVIFMPAVATHTVSAENTADNILSVEVAGDEVTDFAIKAQALLGGYDVEELRKITVNTEFSTISPFLSSKPSASPEGIKVYSYRPTLIERASEYSQVWYKFKTPDAIDDALSLTKTGDNVTSEKILELAFNEARKLVPEDAAAVDALGYTFTFAHQNMFMGLTWIPSTITIELRGEREIYIKTPTLVSSKFIPTVGGMNYCKVFTPGDAARILTDLAMENHDKIPFQNPDRASLDLAAGPSYTFSEVSWDGIIGELFAHQAYLVVDKTIADTGSFKGTCIVSPGGFIPAISMRGLAKAIASEGYIVFIVKYPNEVAFWESIDFRESRTINLAQLIKEKKANKIKGLPLTLQGYYSKGNSPVIALGHSLGGAALGSAIFGTENPFDSIILTGVGSFMKAPWQKNPVAKNVALFFGGKEEKTEESLTKARDLLAINHVADAKGIYHSNEGNRTMQLIPGLSHFCIISDMTVGMDAIRDKDGEGPAPSLSVEIMVDHLVSRGLL